MSPAQKTVTQLHSRRRSTVASPENVFAACAALQAEQTDFSIDEVIARINGGSKSTVSRLVDLWRSQQAIVESTQTLGPELAIGLVQDLEKLLRQIAAPAEAALKRFEADGQRTIAECVAEIERHEETIDAQITELERLSQLDREQSVKIARLEAELGAKTQALAAADEALAEQKQREKTLQESHQTALASLVEEHRLALAQQAAELEHRHEAQRKRDRDAVTQADAQRLAAHQHEVAQQASAYEKQLASVQAQLRDAIEARESLDEALAAREADWLTALSEHRAAADSARAEVVTLVQSLHEAIASSEQQVSGSLKRVAEDSEALHTRLNDLIVALPRHQDENNDE